MMQKIKHRIQWKLFDLSSHKYSQHSLTRNILCHIFLGISISSKYIVNRNYQFNYYQISYKLNTIHSILYSSYFQQLSFKCLAKYSMIELLSCNCVATCANKRRVYECMSVGVCEYDYMVKINQTASTQCLLAQQQQQIIIITFILLFSQSQPQTAAHGNNKAPSGQLSKCLHTCVLVCALVEWCLYGYMYAYD